MSQFQKSERNQQQRQDYHDPPGDKISEASMLAQLRRDDAPALKRYDPSVLIPSDAMSIHASQLPIRTSKSSSFTGMKNHIGSSGKMNNPYLSRTKALPKALPRMKKSDENSSESSVIRSFHREELEPSIIRLQESNDSQSVLRPYPSGGEESNDGKSILKLYTADVSLDTDTREGSITKPYVGLDEDLSPAAERSDYRNGKLDPSITDSTNVSFTSNSTVTQADANHHGDYTPLDRSIASLTMHGVVEEPLVKSDPPSISSELSVFDNPNGKFQPSAATDETVTSEPTYPPSVTDPLSSSTEASFAGNQLEPSVTSAVSNSFYSTKDGQVSNVSHSEPTFRTFPKDPSVVEYVPSQSVSLQDDDYCQENDSALHSSDAHDAETDHNGTAGTFATDHSPSGNSSASTRNDNLSVNLVRKSSATAGSKGGTGNWLNSSSNGLASNYFERSLIEEFNHLIEEEQRESSVMSIPMVPAVLDDATTLVSVAPQINSAAAVGQNQIPEPHTQGTTTQNLSPAGHHNQNITTQGTGATPAPPIQRQSQPVLPRPLPMRQLSKLRQEYGLPVGFVMEIARYQKRAYTYFVCDTNNIEEDCIQECAQLTTTAQSEIVFCLGNNTNSQELLYPPPTDPQMTGMQRQRQVATALNDCVAAIRSATWSTTPTTWTIQKLYELAQRIPKLEYWQREKISVVIVTNRTFGYDGQPELAHFINAIKLLQRIQVQVTIRLSSVDEQILQYYNSMKHAFPPISVLSTYERQKAFVQKHNSWFNYGEPLHRLRELGYHFHSTVDLLSQRKLNKDEVRVFFVEFYGKKAMLYSPDLFTEWEVFYRFVDTINNREGKHRLGLNSKSKDHRDYWINIRKMDNAYATRRRSSLSWISGRSSTRSSVSSLSSKLDQESLRVEL
jgi:hypothetical protein